METQENYKIVFDFDAGTMDQLNKINNSLRKYTPLVPVQMQGGIKEKTKDSALVGTLSSLVQKQNVEMQVMQRKVTENTNPSTVTSLTISNKELSTTVQSSKFLLKQAEIKVTYLSEIVNIIKAERDMYKLQMKIYDAQFNKMVLKAHASGLPLESYMGSGKELSKTASMIGRKPLGLISKQLQSIPKQIPKIETQFKPGEPIMEWSSNQTKLIQNTR